MSITRNGSETRLSRTFSEAEFCRHHGLDRPAASRILLELRQYGIISRSRGHGWRIAPNLHTRAVHDESYEFRMAIEPTAIRSPDFELDRELADRCRRHHETVLNAVTEQTPTSRLLDIDFAFHRLIGVSSRNSFLLAAIERQNALRRILRDVGRNRTHLIESCAEHMEILAAIERAEREEAADLMRRHLVSAHDFTRWLQLNGARHSSPVPASKADIEQVPTAWGSTTTFP